MATRHYLAKSANVLNCLFMLAVAAAAYYIIVPLLNVKIQTTLPSIGNAESEMALQPASPPNPSVGDYVPVVEQSLFHPERKIPEAKRAVSESPLPKPDLVLHGTLIADNLSIAYVEDRKSPYSTPGRGVRQQTLKQGDSISGYILKAVEPNRIVLVRGEEKITVMFDEKVKNRGGETTISAAAPSAPGRLPGPAGPAFSQPALFPAAAVPPAAATPATATSTAPPVSVQGENPPVRTGPAVTGPGLHTYDPRRIRLQNK